MVKIGNYEVKPELLYLNSYTWIRRVSDGEALIGLTDYGQQILKDITSISAPAQGQRFKSGSEMLSIESISREYSLKSPASCVILEVNRSVVTSPDLLNEDPFGNWIVRVEILDLGDLDYLIDGDDMADQILEEVGIETVDVNEPIDDDDDFDYESAFSIDSADDYYEDEDDEDMW